MPSNSITNWIVRVIDRKIMIQRIGSRSDCAASSISNWIELEPAFSDFQAQIFCLLPNFNQVGSHTIANHILSILQGSGMGCS